MSETTPTERGAAPTERGAAAGAQPGTAAWRVRAACEQDVPAVAAAVAELLRELGAVAPDAPALQAATRALLEDPNAGALLVADADGELVGVLAASWQTAIHTLGYYALIQDLWVHSSWRSRSIGADLLAALCELASERRLTRLEVGLPRESFAGLAATQAFYSANGFAPLGPRMRRLLG
jgi:GNAT superfamily N-acetyltransferase